MGEVHIQNHQEPLTPPIIPQKQQPIIIPLDQTQNQTQEPINGGTTNNHSVMIEPIDLFSMMHLTSRRQPPTTTVNNNSTSTKRRSPPSFSSGERSAKKLFCDQEDLTNHGFSSIPLPLSLDTLQSNNGPVLRRCVSEPYNPPENSTPPPARGSGLPPLPPRFRRCLSDITSSRNKRSSRSLNSEENTPDSMRLKRMKDRLREIRQWWDEITKEEEEGEVEEEEYCPVAEEGKILSQDELGRDSEESVSVEWAEKCVSLTFKCPCSKGYEVLISANNCYYKLL